MIHVRLTVDIEERLKALSEATGRTRTFYVREAVLEHLGYLEDLYLAESRLNQNKSAIPLEDVMEQYQNIDELETELAAVSAIRAGIEDKQNGRVRPARSALKSLGRKLAL